MTLGQTFEDPIGPDGRLLILEQVIGITTNSDGSVFRAWVMPDDLRVDRSDLRVLFQYDT